MVFCFSCLENALFEVMKNIFSGSYVLTKGAVKACFRCGIEWQIRGNAMPTQKSFDLYVVRGGILDCQNDSASLGQKGPRDPELERLLVPGSYW